MKKAFGLVAILCAAVLLGACGQKKGEVSKEVTTPINEAGEMKVAFVLLDTLKEYCQQYKDTIDVYEKKAQSIEATLKQKEKNVVNQQQAFQRKMQQNQFTSEEQAQNEYNRIMALQQQFLQDQQSLAAKLDAQTQSALKAVVDSITSFVNVYGKEKAYDFIFCKSTGIDNVLFANESYDVTEEVVKLLNERYDIARGGGKKDVKVEEETPADSLKK